MDSDDRPPGPPTPQVELIDPPDTLLRKVSRDGHGLTARDMLAAANVEVEALRPDCLEAMRGGLMHLDVLFRDWAPGDADPAAVIAGLHDTAGDLGALGATFGYDLVTTLARSLDALLERAPHAHPRLRATVGTHLDALRLVMGRDISGDGGAAGRHLAAALSAMVEAIAAPEPAEPAAGPAESSPAADPAP